MPEFYTKHPGAVVSFTIDKHIYISVNEKFDGRMRVSYSITEDVEHPSRIKHDLVRNTLVNFPQTGLEITSVSDIPGNGSGLGSSSAFEVGLIIALISMTGGSLDAHPSIYADFAYSIERYLCGHSVGKQDHYAAAFGGLRYFQFNEDETVNVETIHMTDKTRNFIEKNILLFWTGIGRRARGILEEQAYNFANKSDVFYSTEKLVDHAYRARNMFEDEDFSGIGNMLDETWYYKKKMSKISNEEIDNLYAKAKLAGAEGGKICGAGGGGFMILVAKPEKHVEIEQAVGLRRVPFKVQERGSHIVFKD